MKRRIVKSLSVLSAVAVMLSFSISASAQETSSKTKPAILSSIQRVKEDYSSPTETDKGSYLQDKSNVLNSKSKKILKLFNVNYDDIKSVEVIQNNELNKTENRAKIGNTCVDFDTDGNIVQFINYNDMTMTNNDKDRKGGEPLPKEKYIINSASDLNLIIDNMVTVNDLQGYKLVDCSNNITGIWTLTWDKDLGNGLINPYDVATCSIDAKDGSVMVFDRSTDTSSTDISNTNTSNTGALSPITPNTTTPTVTKDEAIKLAQPVISKLTTAKNITASLTVTKPNFYWEDGSPYKQADFVRLAWKVTVDNNAVIMIDAQTGEILGGDQTKSAVTTSREMSTVTDIWDYQAQAEMAYDGFGILGYSRVAAVAGPVTQASMNNVFLGTDTHVTALYLSCHGSANYLTDNNNWCIYASDLGGHYWHFVYLDACYTSSTNTFANALHCYNRSNCCFVGWNIEIHSQTSSAFNQHFWERINTMSIGNDVVATLNQCREEGYGDCNPGFIGDNTYYGTSWF